MIKTRGQKKRELSIYSILTIIVLISISGGCAGVHENGAQYIEKTSSQGKNEVWREEWMSTGFETPRIRVLTNDKGETQVIWPLVKEEP